MKRRFRAIFSVMLCLLVIAGSAAGIGEGFLIPADAAELDSGMCGINAAYRFNGSTGTLTISGSGAMEDYNYSLSPFYDNSAIKTVIIENGITSIGRYAFTRCIGMSRIDIPASVESIGEGAFYQCAGLAKILIPNGVEAIEKEAFIACTELKKIYIPASVLEMGTGIFNGCTALTSIIVDKNNPVYDSRENCNAVIRTSRNILISGCSSTVIPGSVTAVGDSAFRSQSGLKSINIPNGVTSIGFAAFRDCSGLAEANIPPSVISIGEEAFYNCACLEEISVPAGTTKIPAKVFFGCSSMKRIDLPEKITAVGDFAFCGCKKLEKFDISDSAESIGEYAFLQCESLAEIVIPANVSSVGRFAFSECTALESVVVDKGNRFFDSRNNCNAVILSATNTLVFGCKTTFIDSSITSISEYAFYRCGGLTSIDIPKSVKAIGTDAFAGIPNINYNGTASGSRWGAENINCFAEGSLVYSNEMKTRIVGCCKAISGETEIPNSVTSIGNGAFEGCAGLTGITFSDNLTEIGSNAFYQCTGLKRITIPDSTKTIGSSAFYECTGLESAELSMNLKSIGEKAFYQCTGLMSITVPDSVTSIGASAFENILNVVYHGTASGSRWGAKNLNGCVDGYLIYSNNYKKVIIGCSKNAKGTLRIPASVINIANGVFVGCGGITSVYVEPGNEEYDSRNDCNAIVHTPTDTLIFGCRSTVIPEDISRIGAYAFSECRGLKTVVLPDSVKKIDENAFYRCVDLESITLTDNVTGIGEYAFYQCSNLKKVGIPDSVTQIGKYAFYGCTGMESFVLPKNLSAVNAGVFGGCTNLTELTVPQAVKNIEDSAFENCISLENVSYSGTYAQKKADLKIMNNKGSNSCLLNAEWNYFMPDAIKVSVVPEKSVYFEGEAVDVTGIRITASYSDGFSEVIDSDFTYSPAFTGPAGTQKITVSYMDKSADYFVAVEHVFKNYIYNGDEKIGIDGTETAKCEHCSETHTRVVEGTAKPYPSYRIKNMELYNGKTIDYRSSLEVSAEIGNCTDVEWHISGASFRNISETCIEIEEAREDFSIYFTAKDLDGKEVTSEKETVLVKQGFFDKLIAFFKGIFKKLPKLRQI